MKSPISENKITGVIIDDESKLAAVVIPIIKIAGKNHLLFEVRSMKLTGQPGDVCFPGGIIEENESALQAALREAEEELFIPKENFRLLGPTHVFHTPGMTTFPFVAELKSYDGRFNKDEVAETFTVPLEFFVNTQPDKYPLEWVRKDSDNFPYDLIVGGKDYKWRKQIQPELFYNYNGRIIWGFTAKIIHYSLVRHAVSAYQIEY